MTARMTPNVVLLILLAAAPANPAAAQIYRCNEGDTTVFADLPCAEDAELHRVKSGISVVAAADLDEVAQRNRAFVNKRHENLVARRARAADLDQELKLSRQRRAAANEEIRYRPVIVPVAGYGFGSGPVVPTDPRVEAQRQRSPARDEPERRRSLLSRSGGNQPHILR